MKMEQTECSETYLPMKMEQTVFLNLSAHEDGTDSVF
jgi:hypothetical protein